MKSSTKTPSSLLDRFFSLQQRAPSSDAFLIKFVAIIVLFSGLWLVFLLNDEASQVTAVDGGIITEGIVGTPRFVNPALASTRADQDVTALVYSGLVKIDTQGNLVNDLAEEIVLSEDGLRYDITLRRDVRFHDGTPLTARDVVYTLQLIQDPDLMSSLRPNWTDVAIAQVENEEYKLTITLEEPYVPFKENFTVGIMPAHLWSSLPVEQLPFSQLNTEPIGSGPFRVDNVVRGPSGLIDHYTLTAFRDSLYNPKIDSFKCSFYANEEALVVAMAEGQIDATSYLSPESVSPEIQDENNLVEVPLPRIFGIFFNQNRSSALRDQAAREALGVALDRSLIITTTVNGYGFPISDPVTFASSTLKLEDGIAITPTSTPKELAVTILENGGWIKNNLGLWEKRMDGETVTLSLTIRTSNAPLFSTLLESITEQWQDIGVEVKTEQFEQTGFVQSVIRPRDYEALLFGIDTNRTQDLYPFWHSSQQNDPGLNIAQYANVTVDDLLEKSRNEQVEEVRIAKLKEASEIIVAERPAVFLFQPALLYLVDENIVLPEIKRLSRPADRFSNITEWHTKSEELWSIFKDSK